MEPSDRECVEGCRRGDPEAFRPLVQRYQRLVCARLTGRLRDPQHVEEAAQEAFVRAWQALGSLRKPASFYAWLLGIADRVALEHLRAMALPHDDAGALVDHPEPQPDPVPDLEQALAALPEAGRRLIQMRYYEGLSCQEVAARLGMPLGTVTKTLSRAFAQLRRELGAEPSLEGSHAVR